MALIVQKYGGSSVADDEKIKNVARRVAASACGNRLVVVVSAMGKTTDNLVALAHQVSSAPEPREMDMLLATGEQVTIALLSMALHGLGLEARSFTGFQAAIRTDRAHTKARITQITAERVRQSLDAGEIAVVAGFQGFSDEDEITTLGRGGSDLTAVALAAALKADVCEIYTDVDGVYTADPAIVPDAKKLARVSYDEMLEMATLGAGLQHLRAEARHLEHLVVRDAGELLGVGRERHGGEVRAAATERRDLVLVGQPLEPRDDGDLARVEGLADALGADLRDPCPRVGAVGADRRLESRERTRPQPYGLQGHREEGDRDLLARGE